MSNSAITVDTSTDSLLRQPPIRSGQLFWIAVIFWVASNVFVTMISKFAAWEGNASYTTMADLCHWDCGWYASILDHGYEVAPERDTGEANWGFHPLFPATAYPLRRWFKLSTPASLVLASKLELLVAIFGFLLLISDHIETTGDSLRAAALVAFNPYVIYAHAGYAEPLYFGLIALAFYLASVRRWVLSGAMSGLASATRILGIFFSAAYLLFWLREDRDSFRRKLDLNQVIGLLLCPVGVALFMLYTYHHVGDALILQHAHVAWGKATGNPLHILRLCFMGHHWLRLWGLMIVAAALLSGWLFKLRQPELGLYLALVVLIAASTGFWGVPRYIWWQPPFLYAIYRILKRYRGLWPIYLAFASGAAAFMVVEWFSGHPFIM